MINDFRYLLSTFNGRDRALLVVYVTAQFFVSLMDLIGLAAVLPLMDVLLGADMTTGYLGFLNTALGEPGRQNFVIIMAVLMVLAFTAKAILGMALQWWSTGVVLRLQVRTASRLLAAYLAEDYLIHRQRDTAEIIRTVDSAVTDAHMKVLGGVLSLLTSGLYIATVFAFLLVVMPGPTMAAVAYFGVIVLALQRFLAVKNRSAGQEAVMSAWAKSLALIDAMQGFREVRMHDSMQYFVSRYDEANRANALASRKANFYGVIPKYVLELMGITGVAVLLGTVALSQQSTAVIPAMGLFVAATVKLLPTMSGITATLGFVRNGAAGLRIAVSSMRSEPPHPSARTSVASLKFSGTGSPRPLEVDRVSFGYPDGLDDVISNISLTVPPGTSLALCGASGSGKTTLVDIILGLIRTERGTVTYDGHPTADLGQAWHEMVAYVPQDVYLLNDTLAANVAFGVAPHERDEARIRTALERAQLRDVVDAMPGGLDSMLGERGSRLSGGQRQRIGIARALYRQPQVIVLDEATSALDNETEDRITQTIRSLHGQITTIIVAHRLSTVRHVDQLAFLEDGYVVASGPFEDVRAAAPGFARMVQLGRLDLDATEMHAPMAKHATPTLKDS